MHTRELLRNALPSWAHAALQSRFVQVNDQFPVTLTRARSAGAVVTGGKRKQLTG
jgi:hypothetical protein